MRSQRDNEKRRDEQKRGCFLLLGNARTLWRIVPAGEIRLSVPLRPPRSNENFYGMRILGARENRVLLHQSYWALTGDYSFPSRLLKIPLSSTVSTAISIQPDGTSDWKSLAQIPPLPTAVLEGREKRVRIQRRGDVRQPAAVTVSKRDVTAKAGYDYIPTSVRLEFRPFETEKIFPVMVLADDEREIEETFEVILSDPMRAEGIAPPTPIRILDEIEGLRLNTIRRLSANEVQITYYWQRGTEFSPKFQSSGDAVCDQFRVGCIWCHGDRSRYF